MVLDPHCIGLIAHVETFYLVVPTSEMHARTLHVLLQQSHLFTLDLTLPSLLRFNTFTRNFRHWVRSVLFDRQTDMVGIDLPEP